MHFEMIPQSSSSSLIIAAGEADTLTIVVHSFCPRRSEGPLTAYCLSRIQVPKTMSSNNAGGPAGPAGPQAGPEGVPQGQSNQNSNAPQQQQQQQYQQGQDSSQNRNTNGNQAGHKLSDRPIIPDERFARPQQQQQGQQQQQQQPEQEQTLGSKYGISLPGIPLEGTNTYTGVQTAEDLSSNLPVIVSVDTTVAPTIGRAALGGGSAFGFTGAADQAHSAAYGGSGAANSPEVMAKKAANITTALGVNDHIAGI